MKKISISTLISLCLIISSFSQTYQTEKTGFDYPKVSMAMFSPDSIKLEFKQMLNQMVNTHPNLFMIVDYDEFYRVKENILDQITKPMNQYDAFRLYSKLNPVLKDGHQAISLPKYRDQIAEACKQGDRIFPIDVFIDKDFRLMVKTPSHGIASGTVIHSINGIDAVEITKYLEQHMFGDNSDVRRNLIADRFGEHLWLQYGSAEKFELMIEENEKMKTVSIDGASELLPHRRGNLSFDDYYSFEMLADNKVGYLKSNTWWYPQGMDQWYAYTDSIFAELRAKDSKCLIIDIRFNGGGDDQMWINGIMPYIANKKWQRMSNFLGRVRDIDEAYPGRLGEVAIFEYLGENEVSDKPKFEGEVYLIVGRRSYSSSIMLAAAIKDNELGKIVGQEEKTFARGCSTGMSAVHDMKTTGIFACTPQHWYQRNTEGTCMEGVEVDIQLNDDPFNEREIVESLVKLITTN